MTLNVPAETREIRQAGNISKKYQFLKILFRELYTSLHITYQVIILTLCLCLLYFKTLKCYTVGKLSLGSIAV